MGKVNIQHPGKNVGKNAIVQSYGRWLDRPPKSLKKIDANQCGKDDSFSYLVEAFCVSNKFGRNNGEETRTTNDLLGGSFFLSVSNAQKLPKRSLQVCNLGADSTKFQRALNSFRANNATFFPTTRTILVF